MISNPFQAYHSKCLCWAYRVTRYWAVIGPPIICYPTQELSLSAWGECVGDSTSTRDEDNSLYISGCKPHLIEPVLWGWVRLKVHFVIKPTFNSQEFHHCCFPKLVYPLPCSLCYYHYCPFWVPLNKCNIVVKLDFDPTLILLSLWSYWPNIPHLVI